MTLDPANDFLEHSDSLKRYAISRTRDPAEAEDLVQECWTRALLYVREGYEIRNPRAYLFAILRNVLADRISRSRRSISVVSIDTVTDLGGQPPNQLSRILWNELAHAIEKLPKDQRQVVQLVGVAGEPYQSAAEIIDVPIGTVMSRLNRGRETLRRTFMDSPSVF